MSNLITISYGDTLEGQEGLEAALSVLAEAGATLEIETIQLGEELVKLGDEQGFSEDELRKIRCSRVLLKAKTKADITPNLCAALGLSTAKETYGENNPAQSFTNDEFAIFEPCENTGPAILNAAIMALKFMQQFDVVTRIENALAKTQAENSPEKFAAAVIANLY